MKRKKRIRLIIIISSVVILLGTVSSAITYLQNITLPAKIKEILTNSLSEETGKIAAIDSVHFILFRGIVIKGLRIYDSDPEKDLLLEAGEITFNYLMLPLFKRKFIIPTLYVNDLNIQINNSPETEEWNFSTIKWLEGKEAAKLPKKYPIIIHKIKISGGNLHFTDNLSSPIFSKEIKKIHANLVLLPAQVKFTTKASLERNQKTASVFMKGLYHFKQREAKFNIKAENVLMEEFEPYYKNILPVKAQQAFENIGLGIVLKGDFALGADSASTDNLKVKIADESVFIKANIKNFKTPLLHAEASSDLKLKNIEPILKGLLPEKPSKDFELDGKAQFVLNFTTASNEAEEAEFSSKIIFRDASIKVPTLMKKIKNINGELELKNDSAITRNFQLTFMDKDYIFDGELKDFQNPKVNAALRSDELSVVSQFNITQKNAHIKKANLNYKGLEASFIGDIYEIYNPILNVYGNVDFLLEDIMPLMRGKFESFKGMDLNGNCKGEILIKGSLSRPRLLEIGLKLISDEIGFKSFEVGDFNMKIVAKDGKANMRSSAANVYGGTLELSAVLDLKKDEIPYELVGHLRDIKLEQLIQKTKLKKSGIYGSLNSSVNISGIDKNLENIKGEGWVHIKDANLGPLPIFIPIMTDFVDFFHKIFPGYEKIMLKEATGTFAIANQKLATDDFILWGNEASILFDGNIDFRGNLDFRVENNFVEGLVDNKTKGGKSLSAWLTGMGSFINEARLTGTIKEPKYEFKALPFRKFFKGGLKGILRDILE